MYQWTFRNFVNDSDSYVSPEFKRSMNWNVYNEWNLWDRFSGDAVDVELIVKLSSCRIAVGHWDQPFGARDYYYCFII